MSMARKPIGEVVTHPVVMFTPLIYCVLGLTGDIPLLKSLAFSAGSFFVGTVTIALIPGLIEVGR